MKKVIFYILFLLLFYSCGADKKIIKKTNEKKTILSKCNIFENKDNFFDYKFVSDTTSFLLYADLSALKKFNDLKFISKFLEKNYFINGKKIYLTVDDFYYSQEFLLYFKGSDKDFNNNKKIKNYKYDNIELIYENNGIEDEYIAVNIDEDNMVYGNKTLIDKLLLNCDNTIKNNGKATIIKDSGFIDLNTDFKLIYLNDNDYISEIIKKYSDNYIIRILFKNLNYILIYIDNKKNNFGFSVIVSNKDNINDLFYMLNDNLKFLITKPALKYGNFDFFKNFRVEKLNKKSLKISFNTDKEDLKKTEKIINTLFY